MTNLRELTIVEIDSVTERDDIENLDLTGFINLERLSLGCMTTGYDLWHTTRLLPPLPRVFTWRIIDFGDRDIRLHDFNQKHEDWVRAMVKFAAQHQRRLECIFIDFLGHENNSRLPESDVYPWDRLDDIDRDSKKLGIRIRYDEPYMSKEEFEQDLRDLANGISIY
ncbi:hypothetical protein NW752_007574 [Fusarium irregulare]|uniref:Uncharacterized protein n=1 Tax=Fusarium irregulare TaxID=2494466 RepID=A0A9W8PI14_9HYPO|nr:hypothetical protein NW766_010130 [Fusarium irregulare]KAJ4013278.1 hypothetical protein NW752_007574 [Fusarium irregulare]